MNNNDNFDNKIDEVSNFEEKKTSQLLSEGDKIETKGLKLRKSTKDRLNELQNKYSDAETMIVALLNQHDTFNVENSDKYSDRKAEIEKFNYLLESIKNSYINSLDMASYLEEKYLERFGVQIKKKDKIINSLQNENISLKESIRRIEDEVKKKGEEVSEAKESFARINIALSTVENELAEKTEVIQNAQSHITTLAEISKESQKYKVENEVLVRELNELKRFMSENDLLKHQCDNYKKDIVRLQNDNKELKEEISNNKREVNDLNHKIQDVLRSSLKEINDIKDTYNLKYIQLETEKNKIIIDNNETINMLKDTIHNLQLELIKK